VSTLIAATALLEPPGGTYPAATWQTKSPADVAMHAAKLHALAHYVGGRGCVVRHGYLVRTWGDAAKRADVASACKPWFSHFLFRAIEAGRIDSVDEPVVRFEPRLGDLNAALGFKDGKIRWRDLACQTSCYGVREPPGEAFDYTAWQMALFLDTLFLQVYDAALQTVDARVLHAQLTGPLECEDNPTFMAFGVTERPGRLAISPRDFARFGLLYLRKGNWNGKQLISAAHVAMGVTSPLPNSIPRRNESRVNAREMQNHALRLLRESAQQ
jgi:CubicO group peptidase (beta-lactamase class C family)